MHDVVVNGRISTSHQSLQSHDEVTKSQRHYCDCHNASDSRRYFIFALDVEGWDRLSKPIDFTKEAIYVPRRFSKHARIANEGVAF